MIVILCQPGSEDTGAGIANDLQVAYAFAEPPSVVTTSQVITWTKPPDWDDMLIIVYQNNQLPNEAQQFIDAFRAARSVRDPDGNERPGGSIIPVALSADATRPPSPIDDLKSLVYDNHARGPEGRLAFWVGVYLGLAIRRPDHVVFVSYRASDGKALAEELCGRLAAHGFHPWMDETRDKFDQEGNLRPGEQVQAQIDAALDTASFILLVDTSEAPESKWLHYEIDAANGRLIPVLPVVVGSRVTRFLALQGFKRWTTVNENSLGSGHLTEDEWNETLEEIGQLLYEIHRRRRLVPLRAEQAFTDNNYTWKHLDPPVPRKMLFESTGGSTPPLPPRRVLSHCSLVEPDNLPALQTIADVVTDISARRPDLNYKLFIYDRDSMLSDAEVESITNRTPLPYILAHYTQLPILIGSDFTRLRP